MRRLINIIDAAITVTEQNRNIIHLTTTLSVSSLLNQSFLIGRYDYYNIA
jgi:hypothetical protein